MTTSVEDELAALGKSFEQVDRELVRLLTERDRLTSEVAKIKWEAKLTIIRPNIEKQRLDAVYKWAQEMGHSNPDAIVLLFRLIINESCLVQVRSMEERMPK